MRFRDVDLRPLRYHRRGPLHEEAGVLPGSNASAHLKAMQTMPALPDEAARERSRNWCAEPLVTLGDDCCAGFEHVVLAFRPNVDDVNWRRVAALTTEH